MSWLAGAAFNVNSNEIDHGKPKIKHNAFYKDPKMLLIPNLAYGYIVDDEDFYINSLAFIGLGLIFYNYDRLPLYLTLQIGAWILSFFQPNLVISENYKNILNKSNRS